VLAACTLASIVALPAQGARSEGIAAGSTARLARTRPAQRAAIGVLRLGDSYHLAGGYNRYDYLIVGYGDLRAASVRSATSLIYKGAADVTESGAHLSYPAERNAAALSSSAAIVVATPRCGSDSEHSNDSSPRALSHA